MSRSTRREELAGLAAGTIVAAGDWPVAPGGRDLEAAPGPGAGGSVLI